MRLHYLKAFGFVVVIILCSLLFLVPSESLSDHEVSPRLNPVLGSSGETREESEWNYSQVIGTEFGRGNFDNVTIRGTGENARIELANLDRWERLNGTRTGPDLRWIDHDYDITFNESNQTLIYDSILIKLVVFGGVRHFCDGNLFVDYEYYSNDTWTYYPDTDNWTEMQPTVHPKARVYHKMAYDFEAKRTVMFGGSMYRNETGLLNDTWTYDSTNNIWKNMTPLTYPTPRTKHTMLYDEQLDKVLLFGGGFNESWTYNISNNYWSKRYIENGPNVAWCQAEYDNVNNRIILYNEEEIWTCTNDQNRFRESGTYVSENITCPDNEKWETLIINKAELSNTLINVSILNATDNSTISGFENIRSDGEINISSINSSFYRSIRLKATFTSNGIYSPTLFSWSINGKLRDIPKLMANIPTDIFIVEDTPEKNIIDLAEYFIDNYSQIEPTVYGFLYTSDTDNITLSLDGSRIDVTNLAENWSGKTDLIVYCGNMHGLFTYSNLFHIWVTNGSDRPMWRSRPPSITLDEDTNYTSLYSLDEYVLDAERDEMEFTVRTDDPNIAVELNVENHIFIVPASDYFTDSYITATVFQKNNHSLNSSTTISLKIRPINDAPQVTLVYPLNGSTVPEKAVELKWNIMDVENTQDKLYSDLYLGKNETPELYLSNISGNNVTINDLGNAMTYYWYVLPYDEEYVGECRNGTWYFSTNISAETNDDADDDISGDDDGDDDTSVDEDDDDDTSVDDDGDDDTSVVDDADGDTSGDDDSDDDVGDVDNSTGDYLPSSEVKEPESRSRLIPIVVGLSIVLILIIGYFYIMNRRQGPEKKNEDEFGRIEQEPPHQSPSEAEKTE